MSEQEKEFSFFKWRELSLCFFVSLISLQNPNTVGECWKGFAQYFPLIQPTKHPQIKVFFNTVIAAVPLIQTKLRNLWLCNNVKLLPPSLPTDIYIYIILTLKGFVTSTFGICWNNGYSLFFLDSGRQCLHSMCIRCQSARLRSQKCANQIFCQEIDSKEEKNTYKNKCNETHTQKKKKKRKENSQAKVSEWHQCTFTYVLPAEACSSYKPTSSPQTIRRILGLSISASFTIILRP